jgi:DivIVA domain-containing protein
MPALVKEASMTMTPREIQEKQFHDAFRGYSHEEVDLFIDQIAEAYDQVYRENQTFHRRLEELEEQLDGGGPRPQVIPAPVTVQASSAPAGTAESEDMLKRVLLTAQESADKAVQNARARAQALIEDAEAKARRIEDQAETIRASTVGDAQRRASETLAAAAKEEAELRERIEGLKILERDFRNRLGAFVRAQLELVEAKPLATSSPSSPSTSSVSGGLWERPRSGARDVPAAAASKPASQAPWLSLSDKPAPAPAESTARRPEPKREAPVRAEAATRTSTSEPSTPIPQRKSAGDGSEKVAEPPAPKTAESPKSKSKAESRSIRELFWGED